MFLIASGADVMKLG